MKVHIKRDKPIGVRHDLFHLFEPLVRRLRRIQHNVRKDASKNEGKYSILTKLGFEAAYPFFRYFIHTLDWLRLTYHFFPPSLFKPLYLFWAPVLDHLFREVAPLIPQLLVVNSHNIERTLAINLTGSNYFYEALCLFECSTLTVDPLMMIFELLQ
jgi:hypothetical protein